MARYIAFIVSSLSFLLVAISSTSVAVAFPDITTEFNATLIMAGWVLTVNQLAGTIIMPLAGKVGDIFGGKRIFLVSIAVFTTGSLLSAVATNIEFLIAARFIQAIGAGSFLPIVTGIIGDLFPDKRQQAIGLFSSIFPIGMIIGPNIGGWLVASYGWRSVFWINIPMGILVFIATLIILKPGKTERGKLDMTGAGLLTGMLSAFLVSLSVIGSSRTGQSWAIFIALLVMAGVMFYLFIRHEKRAKEPIIDIKVLTGRPFQAANYFNLIYGAGILGIMSFVPLYATSVLGMSTLASGLILTPRSVGQLLASTVTSIKLPKWGYRWPMLAGTSLAVVALILLGFEFAGMHLLGMQLSATVLLGVFMFLAGFGAGSVAPASNNACIELMPNRIATITGVRGMFRQIGSAFSISVSAMVLQNFSNIGAGFRVVFFGLAVILALSIPFIFIMPRSATDTGTPAKGKRTTG